jgi:Rrf2 family protein
MLNWGKFTKLVNNRSGTVKLSTRTRYGTRALVDLARHNGSQPVQLKEIAGRQGISLHYLEHIIAPLVAAGIVRSIRGAHGGLQLARPAQDVKLNEVVGLLEGATAPVDCIANPGSCERAGECVTREVWADVQQAIDGALGAVSIRDLLERQQPD